MGKTKAIKNSSVVIMIKLLCFPFGNFTFTITSFSPSPLFEIKSKTQCRKIIENLHLIYLTKIDPLRDWAPKFSLRHLSFN